MATAGEFAFSDTSAELHVITAYCPHRGNVVRLCRLSNGLQLRLALERITVPEDGIGAFRTHVIQLVTTASLGEQEPMKRSASTSFADYLDRYVEMAYANGALYRIDGIFSYMAQQEWTRFNHPTYSEVQAVKDIRFQCEMLGIQPPSDSVLKARIQIAVERLRRKHIGSTE